MVSDEILHEALDVMNGEFTCCRLGHPNEDPCDREELMLPLLGLYADIYRERHGKHAEAYAFIEPIKDRLFPATFKYTHRSPEGVETTTTQVLFGDLIAAVEHTTDQEKSVDVKATARAPDFKPGTNAQRHRLHHAKHGSKHGSAHASGRLSMANIFGSSGSTLSSKQRSGSGSVDALAPAEPSDRPRLARSLTWRATPPALPKEPSSSQV